MLKLSKSDVIKNTTLLCSSRFDPLYLVFDIFNIRLKRTIIQNLKVNENQSNTHSKLTIEVSSSNL